MKSWWMHLGDFGRTENSDEGDGSHQELPDPVKAIPWGFVPRPDTCKPILDRWSGGQRQAVLLGGPFTGKTAIAQGLCNQLAAIQGGQAPVPYLWIDLQETHQDSNLLSSLWFQLQRGREGGAFDGALAEIQRIGITGETVFRLICQLATDVGGLLLILDGAEHLLKTRRGSADARFADPELAILLRKLWAHSEADARFGVLVTSRKVLPSLQASSHLDVGPMLVLEGARLLRQFRPFPQWSGQQLMALVGQGDKRPGNLLLTGALAALVEDDSVASSGVQDPFSALWQRLEPEVQGALVNWIPVSRSLPWAGGARLWQGSGTGAQLASLALLQPEASGDGRWCMPAWVAEQVQAQASDQDWPSIHKSTHGTLGTYFAERFEVEPSPEWDRAAVLHFVKAGRASEAWDCARRLVLSLRHGSRYREAKLILERCIAAGLADSEGALARVFRCQVARLAGVPLLGAESDLRSAVREVLPADRSFALDELAATLKADGQLEEAISVLEQSVAVERADKGAGHPDVGASMRALSRALQEAGHLDRAEALLNEAVRLADGEPEGDVSSVTVEALDELAKLLTARGRSDEANRRMDESIALKRQLLGSEAQGKITASLHELAGIDISMGRHSEAKAKLLKALALEVESYGSDAHPQVIVSLQETSRVMQMIGDLSGASEMLERALAAERSLKGDDNPAVMDLLAQLGGLYMARGKAELAIPLFKLAVSTMKELSEEDRKEREVSTLLAYAASLQAAGRLPACREALDTALALQLSQKEGCAPEQLLATHNVLGGTLKAMGELVLSEVEFRAVLALQLQIHGEKRSLDVAVSQANLAQVLMEMEQLEEAGVLVRQAYDTFLQEAGPTHPITTQLARLIPGSTSEMVTNNPIFSHVCRVFVATAGIGLSRVRLEQLTWRIMVREQAGPMLPILLIADIQGDTPGLLASNPGSLAPPTTAPEALRTMWSGLVMELAQAHAQFKHDFNQLLAHLSLDQNSHVQLPEGTEFPERNPTDEMAMVDEARAALVSAQSQVLPLNLETEIDLWSRTAEICLIADPSARGAELCKRLVAMLPHRSNELTERWRSLTTDQHKAALGMISLTN